MKVPFEDLHKKMGRGREGKIKERVPASREEGRKWRTDTIRVDKR
jgi:hypothetical protein